ncbi:hypothetical protein JCM9279_004543 [Rhodotorula babjevae]
MLPAAPPPPEERARPPPLPPKNHRGRELGLLVAVVDRARNLDCGSSDGAPPPPFVELALTGSVDPKVRTRVDDRGRGEVPVWDEEFRFRLFEVDGSPRQHLVVKVKRREHDQGDHGEADVELVGEARIMVDGSWDHFDQWVPLKRDGKYQGEIYLELTFYKPEQSSPRQTADVVRPPLPAQHYPSPGLAGAPALVQQLGQMSVHDLPPSTSAAADAPRRTSMEQYAPLPLPGEPDSPHLPASLRPGRPTRQAPPPPTAIEPPAQQHAHAYSAGRLPSPGAASVVGLSSPAPWSATPSQHAASYPPPRVASAAPAIAVSQPTLLTAATYPAPAQHPSPAFVAPRLSSTPVTQLPRTDLSTSPRPLQPPQHGHHGSSPSSALLYYASPEPSPPFAAPPTTTTFFPSPSLPPRSPSPSPSRPPVPPRPSSAASVASVTSLSRMPGAMPASPPIATSPSPFDLAPSSSPAPPHPPLDHRRSSLSPHPASHPAEHRPSSAASRPLPPNPSGDIRPSPTPSLDSKRLEASSSAVTDAYEPPPPSYASDASGSTVTLTPRRAAAEAQSDAERREAERRARIIEEQRVRMDEERRRADEARRRSEEEARRRAEEEAQRVRRREEDEARRRREQEAADRRRLDAERQRASHEEAAARAARIERERLAQVEAAQRVRAARRAQEEEDARMAAQLAEEAEEAERAREAERRAADEEAVRRLLDEERAAAALAQQEREREDEEFARRFREEERRREAEERGERERADEALARRMRAEEDAERQRALVEDERIARSLAEQQGERRARTDPARS